jgi:hypothetical protein
MAADGTLQIKLPVGSLQLKVSSPTAGLDSMTQTVLVVEGGGDITVRM